MRNEKKVLDRVLKYLNDAKIRFSIGGSGLLYFLCEKRDIGDWDILTSASVESLKQVFFEFEYEILGPKPPYCSDYVFRFVIDGIDIEIIGNFTYEVEGQKRTISVEEGVQVGEVKVSSPEKWLEFYRFMNDFDKVKLLTDWLEKNRR